MKTLLDKFQDAYRYWRFKRAVEQINRSTAKFVAYGDVRQIQEYAQSLRNIFTGCDDITEAINELADYLERDAELIVMKRVFKV